MLCMPPCQHARGALPFSTHFGIRPSARSAEALVSHCIDFRAGSQETDAGSPGWLGPGGLAGWEWPAIGIANGCNWFSPFDSSRLHQDLHELLESIYLYVICDYFCWTLLIIFDNIFFFRSKTLHTVWTNLEVHIVRKFRTRCLERKIQKMADGGCRRSGAWNGERWSESREPTDLKDVLWIVVLFMILIQDDMMI